MIDLRTKDIFHLASDWIRDHLWQAVIGFALLSLPAISLGLFDETYGLLDGAFDPAELWFIGLEGALVALYMSKESGPGRAFRAFLPALGLGVVINVLTRLGILAALAPGLWVVSAAAIAIPVLVLEHESYLGAVMRSASLTKGNRGALLVFFGLALLPQFAVRFGLGYGFLEFGRSLHIGLLALTAAGRTLAIAGMCGLYFLLNAAEKRASEEEE